MITLIVILSVFIIFYLIEVFHDDILRLVHNKGRFIMIKLESATASKSNGYKAGDDIRQDNNWKNDWHKLDFASHALIALLTGYLYYAMYEVFSAILLPIVLGMLRILILNLIGNKVAKRKLLYVGDGWLEKIFKGHEKYYYLVVVAVLAISIYFLIKGRV